MDRSYLKKIILPAVLISFLLTSLSFLYVRSVVCDCGSLSVVSLCDCTPGQIDYKTHGWPVEYYWSNETGFVLLWYLLDWAIYLAVVIPLLTIPKVLGHTLPHPRDTKKIKVKMRKGVRNK